MIGERNAQNTSPSLSVNENEFRIRGAKPCQRLWYFLRPESTEIYSLKIKNSTLTLIIVNKQKD